MNVSYVPEEMSCGNKTELSLCYPREAVWYQHHLGPEALLWNGKSVVLKARQTRPLIRSVMFGA